VLTRHEKAIIAYLKKHPVVSIFWITKNQKRAWAIQSLNERNVIQRRRNDPRDYYPYCFFEVSGE